MAEWQVVRARWDPAAELYLQLSNDASEPNLAVLLFNQNTEMALARAALLCVNYFKVTYRTSANLARDPTLPPLREPTQAERLQRMRGR